MESTRQHSVISALTGCADSSFETHRCLREESGQSVHHDSGPDKRSERDGRVPTIDPAKAAEQTSPSACHDQPGLKTTIRCGGCFECLWQHWRLLVTSLFSISRPCMEGHRLDIECWFRMWKVRTDCIC